jgi:hypothetical protein
VPQGAVQPVPVQPVPVQPGPAQAVAPQAGLGPEYDVYETLIRDVAVRYDAKAPTRPAAIVVHLRLRESDDDTTPPAEFLRRFNNIGIPVKADAGQSGKKVDFVDVNLGPVEWQGASDARVSGTVFESWVQQKCGTPWPMHASRASGKWCAVNK